MKNIYKITLLLSFLILASCGDEYLNPVPNSVINSANYYTTEEQLETAIINMYDGIQGTNVLEDTDSDKTHSVQYEYFITEMRSDNTRTKASEGEAAEFENYSIQTGNGIVADYYKSMYNIIFRANVVLENLGVASEANAPKFEAEAKFVRAYAYFNLVRLWGDVPLIDELIKVSNTDKQFTRVPSSQIYDFIVSDLQVAALNLDNTHIFRASKRAAQAMLAKVYLTRGTNYVEAQQLCEEVMMSGATLQINFKDIFYNEGNNELLFAIGYLPDNALDSQNFSTEMLNAVGRQSGLNYVTTEARAALDAMGGNRTLYSYRQDPTQPSQYQVVKFLPNGDANLGIAPTSNDPRSAGNDWIVLRYADVLLMHVEAIMAGQTSTSAQAALDSFEQIRLRAGLTGDADGVITKEELLDERRVELAFENHRFFDLVRFGVAQSTLSSFSTDNGYSFTATDLLLPIPQREINLSNGLLTQNPGY
ncbi:RagB/SusD family nutrient uptake outer membrane protein [Flavobacterium sp. LMO8]|uniref:RagB/SusD family nutrient uptake outer membrane protein n=1 Tax=Flavobacterium sp. LMO8 TaxID=2654244 RepID=UPI001291396C|nr:RagB/SusD family nutrient uptake outer membrane protein [Flavobacterium sp. LMO8]MQP24423.1 RagB/SusD family nutrient uptake outer membrane protein [Flavobacterium sp. LMO8]